MHEWKPLSVIIWDEWANRRRTGSVLYSWIPNLCMRLFHNGTILLSVNQHFQVPEWQDWDLTLSSFRFSLPFVILWCRQLSNLLLSNLLGCSTVPFFLLQFFWMKYLFFVCTVWILAGVTRNNPSAWTARAVHLTDMCQVFRNDNYRRRIILWFAMCSEGGDAVTVQAEKVTTFLLDNTGWKVWERLSSPMSF